MRPEHLSNRIMREITAIPKIVDKLSPNFSETVEQGRIHYSHQHLEVNKAFCLTIKTLGPKKCKRISIVHPIPKEQLALTIIPGKQTKLLFECEKLHSIEKD